MKKRDWLFMLSGFLLCASVWSGSVLVTHILKLETFQSQAVPILQGILQREQARSVQSMPTATPLNSLNMVKSQSEEKEPKQ